MMKSITLHDKVFVPFISNEEIEKAIDKVAEEVKLKHSCDEQAPILLCVLNGAILFTAELMKRLDFPCELMSIKVSSYEGTESQGVVRETLGLNSDIKGRNIII